MKDELLYEVKENTAILTIMPMLRPSSRGW